MESLLSRTLPTTGFICVDVVNPSGKGFRHNWCNTVEEAERVIQELDAAGHTVYVAQSTFQFKDNRKAVNTKAVRSFFFDIDCGEGKPYATQNDGYQALKTFCGVIGLPMPAVVSSGNGLYAHWPLTEEVLPDQWKAVADILKKLSAAHGFHTDPARTSDLSSVLRPVGATNRKRGESKPVQQLTDCPSIEFTAFASLLYASAKALKIDVTVLTPPKPSDLNSEFAAGLEGPPSSGVKVADHCAQISKIRDTKGNVPEPEWYAAIGVLRHCSEGRDLIHEWSSGHPDYNPEATNAKIEQHKMPPTTCHYFGEVNPTACIGCKHNGKIKTPIVLGREVVAIAVQEDNPDRVDLPAGYILTQHGLVWEEDEIRFYPYDIYVKSIAIDMAAGVEAITMRFNKIFEGWTDFVIPSAALQDPKTLLMRLQENGVGVVGATERKIMADYIARYVEKVRATNRSSKLYAQMGWHKEAEGDDMFFILGRHMYMKDGTVIDVGLARNVPEVVKAFHSKGDLEEWVKGTRWMGQADMTHFAFTFLAGAFGASLMQFTGFDGAIISCVGDSGAGKTLAAKYAQSCYGYFPQLMMLNEDTKNSLVSRLGVYGSLPLTIDEVTNIDPMDLSSLVYRVTQGRDKARLSRNATERSNINHWKTMAIVSSNSSLIDKLGSAKSDASAELNRVFEFNFPQPRTLNSEVGRYIHRLISDNYGAAGEKYIQYLVTNQTQHVANLDRIADTLTKRTGAAPEERFLIAVAAATIYGGLIAKKLNIIDFAMEPVIEWAVDTIQSMRSHKGDQILDCIGVLGQFFDSHYSRTLVVRGNGGKQMCIADRYPSGELAVRCETDTLRCYISRDALKKHLNKTYGSYARLKRDLEMLSPRPALLRHDYRKVLGSNVHGYGGASQCCWELDLTCPQLGNVVVQLVPGQTNDDFHEKAQVIPMRGRN